MWKLLFAGAKPVVNFTQAKYPLSARSAGWVVTVLPETHLVSPMSSGEPECPKRKGLCRPGMTGDTCIVCPSGSAVTCTPSVDPVFF